MLCYESWPEEQWRYAVNKEEEKIWGQAANKDRNGSRGG